MQVKIRLIWLVLLLLFTQGLSAQRYGKNYPSFEHKKFHFGTALGGNSTSYRYVLKTNFGE
ncbi:MAG: hypothetical protein ACI8ZM_005553, partial [Crocinitomix sp.]